MKRWPVANCLKALFLAGAGAGACLLTACADKPLTEIECRVLINKQIEFALQSLPPEEADRMGNFIKGDPDAKTAACVADRKRSRKYYQCMLNARNLVEGNQCVKAELARQ